MPAKIGTIVVADFERRSKKGLEYAKQILRGEKLDYPKLRDALEHYLLNWKDSTYTGLFSIAYEAVGGNPEDAIQTQAAMAMMSAAFDLHDDIIDKSETKHKRSTVYGMFGAELALLLGDAFLLEGFKLFVDSTANLPREKGQLALDTIKRLLFEVGNAHALEVGLRAKKDAAPEDYMKIIKIKAASIEAEMHLGALFGGGEDAEIETLARLGRILGVLGTLREEFIDVFEIEELRQRILAKDLPLPLMFAMQDKSARAEIMNIISKPKITKHSGATLLDVVLEAEPVVTLRKQMKQLTKEGRLLTNKNPKIQMRKQLQAILVFMLEDL